MSDIEILLRELIDKVDNLEKKVDKIEKQVIPPEIKINYNWGDDNCAEPLKPEEWKIGDIVPNPYEIKCKGE